MGAGAGGVRGAGKRCFMGTEKHCFVERDGKFWRWMAGTVGTYFSATQLCTKWVKMVKFEVSLPKLKIKGRMVWGEGRRTTD